jgi:hypothetical protein
MSRPEPTAFTAKAEATIFECFRGSSERGFIGFGRFAFWESSAAAHRFHTWPARRPCPCDRHSAKYLSLRNQEKTYLPFASF